MERQLCCHPPESLVRMENNCFHFARRTHWADLELALPSRIPAREDLYLHPGIQLVEGSYPGLHRMRRWDLHGRSLGTVWTFARLGSMTGSLRPHVLYLWQLTVTVSFKHFCNVFNIDNIRTHDDGWVVF